MHERDSIVQLFVSFLLDWFLLLDTQAGALTYGLLCSLISAQIRWSFFFGDQSVNNYLSHVERFNGFIPFYILNSFLRRRPTAKWEFDENAMFQTVIRYVLLNLRFNRTQFCSAAPKTRPRQRQRAKNENIFVEKNQLQRNCWWNWASRAHILHSMKLCVCVRAFVSSRDLFALLGATDLETSQNHILITRIISLIAV